MYLCILMRPLWEKNMQINLSSEEKIEDSSGAYRRGWKKGCRSVCVFGWWGGMGKRGIGKGGREAPQRKQGERYGGTAGEKKERVGRYKRETVEGDVGGGETGALSYK